jgi:hypothetical protein
MSQPLGLMADAARDLLDIARHIGELDPEAADPGCELLDQIFGARSRICMFQYCALRERHLKLLGQTTNTIISLTSKRTQSL